MFYPLPLYIGLRYLRTKKRNGFISFISFASVFGIALGVTVLITVLSVMNGFDNEIRQHIFDLAPHVMITNAKGAIADWPKLAHEANKIPQVIASAPYINGESMLSAHGLVSGVMATGIIANQEMNVFNVKDKMVSGSFTSLTDGSFNVVIGFELALRLNLHIGDKVTLISPEATLTPLGIMPRFKRLNVSGIFHIDSDPNFDSGIIFMNLYDAQKIFALGNNVTGLRLKVKDLYDAPQVSAALGNILPDDYQINDWTNSYGALFKAIQMEKTMMFIVLLFIIGVAAFNLISSLVMTVNEKQGEIAILRTLGASPKTIITIFIVQGGLIGAVGTFCGVIGGTILALNATQIVAFIEHIFHTKFISAAVYFVDYLPSQLEWHDILHVGLAALILSLVATVFPALRAAKVKPAEVLRYE